MLRGWRVSGAAFAAIFGLFGGVASAAVPVRLVSPAREVFRGGGGAGALVTAALATPDNGVLVLGDTGKTWFYVTKLTGDGALDSAFGDGGVARVSVGLSGFTPTTITRQTDGKLVIGATFETPLRSAVVRLNADGSLDQSFGNGGVALPAILGLVDLALGPGDTIILSGSTSTASARTRWAVARLTPQGAPDESFGQAGIETLPGPATTGLNVAALANGDIVVIGQYIRRVPGGATIVYLTRLLASGASDPGFSDGVPVTAPPSEFYDLVANPDGSVILGQAGQLVRYTPAGLPDATFGTGGIAPLKAVEGELQLLSAPSDGAVAVGEPQDGVIAVDAITQSGTEDPSLGAGIGIKLRLGFGGGGGPFAPVDLPGALPGLAQDSVTHAVVVRRPDGSYVVAGNAYIYAANGGQTDYVAAEALTPAFIPNTTFAGPAQVLRTSLRIPMQRAATDRSRDGIRVTVKLSAPGLCRVIIKSRGRIVAEGVLPAPSTSASTQSVTLTPYGARLLSSGGHLTIRALAQARDLLTNTATTATTGALR